MCFVFGINRFADWFCLIILLLIDNRDVSAQSSQLQGDDAGKSRKVDKLIAWKLLKKLLAEI